MSKNKKRNIVIWVILAVLVISALLPFFISLGSKNKNEAESVRPLNVIDYNIEFKENSRTINLLSGEIITNEKISSVFINVNGYGTQYLEYVQQLNDNNCYVVTLTPVTNVLDCVFYNDTKITADIYVEYDNRSYKVVSNDIAVMSSWTNSH